MTIQSVPSPSVASLCVLSLALSGSLYAAPQSPKVPAAKPAKAAPAKVVPAKVAVKPQTKVAGPALLLAQDSQALMPIVVSPTATEATKTVANELAGYLSRIAGAHFKVQVGDGSSGIVLGTLDQYPVKELQKPLELRGAYDGVEAYAIRTEAKRVLLLGRTDLGASHAAYRFLETLGCRWFFPGKAWEVVPGQGTPVTSTLMVNVNESSRPAILSRRVWPAWGLWDKRSQEDDAAWNRRNRQAQSFNVRAGHAWDGVVAANKAEFAAHPEYFALVKQADGTLKRQAPMLELGNPKVRQLAIDWVLKVLRDHPEEKMVSIEPSDGTDRNESPESKAYGTSVSDQVFGLANEVARAVQREFPGKMVGMLAYSNHTDPPSFALEPNVYVQLTNGYNFSEKGLNFDQLLAGWRQKTRNLGLYAYLDVWVVNFDRLPGAPIQPWAKLMRRFGKAGVTSVDAERSSNWGLYGLGYYIANRVLWNPEADVDVLLQDFYSKAFGPAGPAMRRYYERLDGETQFLSRDLIAMAMNDLQEATQLAKDRPDVQARLDDLKGFMVFVSLREQFDAIAIADKAKRREAALKMYTQVYRTRYSYMEHWRPLETVYAGTLANQLEEPSWVYTGGKTPRPWEVEPAYTHEDIETLFQQTKATYPVQQEEERIVYSNDLVPANLAGAQPVATSFWGANLPANLAQYSVKGEPLVLTLVPGAYKAGMPEGHYRLTDKAGKVLFEASLPQDKQEHRLELKVPQAGLYFWEIEDKGGGTRIKMDGKQPLVMLMDKKQLGTVTLPPWYFYVPKGTRKIQFYWGVPGAGGTIEVRNPTNQVAREVTMPSGIGGVLATVPVPDGQDGQAWSLHGLFLGRVTMVNIPGVLAMSPYMLMVPREVARRDGLTIAAK